MGELGAAMSGDNWVLRVEGVNFSATLFDTNDLSTIRGSGLALLHAADAINQALLSAGVHPEPIFAGASLAAFRFTAPRQTAESAAVAVRDRLGAAGAGGLPLHHLIFSVDLAEIGADGEEGALLMAEARNRARQLRNFTVPVPRAGSAAMRPDVLEHTRQAETTDNLPDRPDAPLSHSVAERRRYGRAQRSGFYARFRPPPDAGRSLPVCDSFDDQVVDPPAGLPVAPRNKLAFLYGDGNAFNAIRQSLGVRRFSAGLRPLQEAFLRRLTTWLADGVTANDRRRAVKAKDGWVARFETLTWGGDEFLFVMPSWLGLPVLAEVEAALRGWALDGHALTFGLGLAICDRKTPARIARRTANDLADSAKAAAKKAAKTAAQGSVPSAVIPPAAAIQVFESQSPIDAPLAALRGRQFGVPPDGVDALGARLVLRAEALGGLVAHVRSLTSGSVRDGALSPSVLHRAIVAARRVPGGLASAAADDAARKVLHQAFNRFGRDAPTVRLAGFMERGTALDLCLVAMLRDYCAEPEGGDVAPFPGATP